MSNPAHDPHEPCTTTSATAATRTRDRPLDPRALAGLEGEKRTRDALAALPRMFHTYSNIDVPNPRSRGGHNEADLLVAGPTALFVIEVKHHRGAVIGGERDMRWGVTRHCGGREIVEPVGNAVTQVKRLSWLLRQHFEEHGYAPWVQGVVVFSHPEVELRIDSMSVPCWRLDELVARIRAFSPKGGCSRGTLLLMERLARESAKRAPRIAA